VSPSPQRDLWLAALGGALLALAGHLYLILHYGTVLPYRDQWQLMGVELIRPWLEGELALRHFFQPLNDHWPVLTRLWSWGLFRLNGLWDNQVEITANALLFAGVAFALLRVVLPAVPGALRPFVALGGGVVMALPLGWENTLWGIQSLPYFQVGLTLLFLSGVLLSSGFSRSWWLAQLAGLFLLLTQYSAILAHVVLLPVLVLRLWSRPDLRKADQTALGISALIVVLFFCLYPEMQATAHLRADSLPLAIEVTLRQLAWPTDHPAWAFLLWAPWLVLAIDAAGRRQLKAPVALLLALGLWAGGQAAAIGYGRAVDTHTFVSRYTEILTVGFLANAAALAHLIGRLPPRRWRPVAGLMLALAWIGPALPGFHWETFASHAGHNLGIREQENRANIKRVQTYLETKDPTVLSLERGGALLFTYPPAVQQLLDRTDFVDLLNPEAREDPSGEGKGRFFFLVHFLPRASVPVAVVGFLLLGLAWLLRSRAATGGTGSSVWTLDRLLMLGVAALLVTAGLWSSWETPLQFDSSIRHARLLQPEGPDLQPTPLQITHPHGPPVDTQGAILTRPHQPSPITPFSHGTAPGGPSGFQGTLHSQPIPLSHPHLNLLFTGYPCAHGNGLRWELRPPDGGEAKIISYVGRNAGTAWLPWTVDVSDFTGGTAVLWLFDGREDAEGWLGVTAPVQTVDSQWAEGWLSRLRAERAAPAQATLAGVTLSLLFGCLIGGVVGLIRRSHDRKSTHES
jgi:hypothetical protein